MSDVEPTTEEAPEEEAVVEETTAAEPDPLAEAQAKAAEYLELAQRKQAEFENFRKRAQAQSAQAETRGIARLAKELLTPLDHLGLAIQHAEDAGPLESLRDEFLGALGRVGVESFSPQGEAFDPNQHEAMAQVPVEGTEPGKVTEVYQSGYRLGDTILRPARVVVSG